MSHARNPDFRQPRVGPAVVIRKYPDERFGGDHTPERRTR